MNRLIFINLPVKDLKRSLAFFKALGFGHNPEFTDDTAACVVISDVIHVMILTEAKFQSFTAKSIADAHATAEVINAISCGSREEVDDLVKRAVSAGGKTYNDPIDHGFMYYHGFQDPDGHIWELLHMEASPTSQS